MTTSQFALADASAQVGFIDTLIIVCCHAIYLDPQNTVIPDNPKDSTEPKSLTSTVEDEVRWLIESFQKGEIHTFITHIREGLQQLAQTPSAILCFSGGATKPNRTTRTEAQGYREVAEGLNYFGLNEGTDGTNLSDRVFEEPWATDSYQNVLLSLIQFPVWVQKYRTRMLQRNKTNVVNQINEKDNGPKKASLHLPQRLIIVTHAFKRSRFIELHLPAINNLWENFSSLSGPQNDPKSWDLEQWKVIGSDPPYEAGRMKEIEEGNKMRGYGVWEKDLYGMSHLLSGKREARGWDEEKFMNAMGGHFIARDVKRIKKMVQGVVEPDFR